MVSLDSLSCIYTKTDQTNDGYIGLMVHAYVIHCAPTESPRNEFRINHLVPRPSQPRATHGTGSVKKLAVVSNAHARELIALSQRDPT